MTKKAKIGDEPVIIKKYANRRLYNTASSSYVTLDHLAQMVKNGTEFIVYDAKTSEDITRSVLTQIIFEEEAKGENLLPVAFLRQLISFYGDNMQTLVPGYLEMSMDAFTRNQDQFHKSVSDAFGGNAAFNQFEEMIRQNLAMHQKAVSMFNPFSARQASAENGAPDDSLDNLKEQVAAMQRQLSELIGKK